MKTTTHTKRSEGFQQRLDVLIDYLQQDPCEFTPEMNAKVIEVLENNTTDSGCLVNAELYEPIFVLRGKDVIATLALLDWIKSSSSHGTHADKLSDAIQCLSDFVAYRRKQKQQQGQQEIK